MKSTVEFIRQLRDSKKDTTRLSLDSIKPYLITSQAAELYHLQILWYNQGQEMSVLHRNASILPPLFE